MYQRIKRVIPGSMIPGDARIVPLQRSAALNDRYLEMPDL